MNPRDVLIRPFQLMSVRLHGMGVHPWEVSRQAFVGCGILAGVLLVLTVISGTPAFSTSYFQGMSTIAPFLWLALTFLLFMGRGGLSKNLSSPKLKIAYMAAAPVGLFATLLGFVESVSFVLAWMSGSGAPLALFFLGVLISVNLTYALFLHEHPLPAPNDARVVKMRWGWKTLLFSHLWLVVRLSALMVWFLRDGSIECLLMGALVLLRFVGNMFMQVDIPHGEPKRRTVANWTQAEA